MTRDEKAQIIDELSVKFSQHTHFYVTDASGLSVEQINAFRRLCFKSGVEYRVYKNTLIRKALEKNGFHSCLILTIWMFGPCPNQYFTNALSLNNRQNLVAKNKYATPQLALAA
jgi:ribosomal protein L10